MERFGTALVAIVAGLLSAAVFVIVFAITALPALLIVEDDNAFITWGVLIACVLIGLVASRWVNRWMRGLWDR